MGDCKLNLAAPKSVLSYVGTRIFHIWYKVQHLLREVPGARTHFEVLEDVLNWKTALFAVEWEDGTFLCVCVTLESQGNVRRGFIGPVCGKHLCAGTKHLEPMIRAWLWAENVKEVYAQTTEAITRMTYKLGWQKDKSFIKLSLEDKGAVQ
jgi:hypothetical protein